MAVRQIAFHVTDRCQLDCKHCLRDPGQSPRDLSVALITRVLDEAVRLHGVDHVSLTGGEPTLHPEFMAIVDAVAARQLTWHMVTNGRNLPWLLGELGESPARRASISQLYLSLDGPDATTHDAIRGEGSFQEVMVAVSLATAHGIPFVLQLVVNAINEPHIEATGLLAAQLGATAVSFCMLQPTGTQHDRTLAMTSAKWWTISDRLDRLAHTLRIPIRTPEGWPHKQPFYVCEPFSSTQLHVDVHGRLNLCCQHADIPQAADPPSGESDVVGDLHQISLADAHLNMLGVIHRAEAAKLKDIARGHFDEWDHFPCNWCLKYFGKPHWGDEGALGPEAARERWVGAWGEAKGQAPTRKRLPLVR